MSEVKTKHVIEDIKGKRDRQELAELLAERAKWSRLKKEAEDNGQACTEALNPLMARLGVSNILADNDLGEQKQFIRQRGKNSTIKREKLINKGVDPSIIDECTDVTEYWTIQVRSVAVKE